MQQAPPVAPVAPVVAGGTGGLIDKIGLVAGMVMAQKSSNRSKDIERLELAQLAEVKA